MDKKRLFRSFIAGSAFPVIIWPFLYLGVSFHFNPASSLNMGLVPLSVPILLGLANTIFVQVIKKPKKKDYWIMGSFYGLVLSIYANFVTNLPTDLFLLSGPIQYATIPFAIIAYSLIWRYPIRMMNQFLSVHK